MDDDESLALALALSAAESGHQNSSPFGSRADTSNDEALARRLQQESASGSFNGPATYQRQEQQPHQTAVPERPAIPGNAPSGFAAVLGGLKGLAKRPLGILDANGGTKRPGHIPSPAGALWLDLPSVLARCMYIVSDLLMSHAHQSHKISLHRILTLLS